MSAAFRRVVAAAAFSAATSVVLAETRHFATVPLLGGSADWRFSSWRAITDQLRGGVSTAALEPCGGGARFTGNLDPSKLSAGFAGMNLDVKVLPVSFSDLDGLKLGVLDADGREYTLLLKLKGGESGSSYQVRFVPQKQTEFEALFKDFAAYRRGRPDASAPPLDKSEIETLAIQIASNFTQQSGRFQLELQSIAGLK
mmetsp:Transcript_82705/g.130836  ORF Transcript_82705/g.130836 Transcript_82705/m.130836 type:complete len:199 (+) Transcript_82705:53-649(+)